MFGPISSNMPLKSKSPYKLQLENFEKRLQKSQIKPKFPDISSRNSRGRKKNELTGAEFLHLAKRLMNNQEKVVWQNKQNFYQNMEKANKQLACIKFKVGTILKKSLISQTSTKREQFNEYPINWIEKCQQSRITNMISKQSAYGNRSRAMSTASQYKDTDLNEPNFLAYKKYKRELSARSKNE